MKPPAHTITLDLYQSGSLGERVGLDIGTALLFPLAHDKRLTVLINLLAVEIAAVADDDDAVDAIIDILRLKMKWHTNRS